MKKNTWLYIATGIILILTVQYWLPVVIGLGILVLVVCFIIRTFFDVKELKDFLRSRR